MAIYRVPIKPFLTFIDEPEEETPLSASNLNFIQNELKEALNGKFDCSSSVVKDANSNRATYYGGIYSIGSGAKNLPFDTSKIDNLDKKDYLITIIDNSGEYGHQFCLDTINNAIWHRIIQPAYNEDAKVIKDWTKIYQEPKILYDSDTGTQGNITLLDSVENYKYIEIYFTRAEVGSDNGEGAPTDSTKVDDPNGKYVSLTTTYSPPSSEPNIGLQIFGDKVYINGTTISRITGCMFGVSYHQTIDQYDRSTSNGKLYIYKVIGYGI